MMIELSETGLAYNATGKSWSPSPGKKWRVMGASGYWTAGSTLTAANFYAAKWNGGIIEVILFETGSQTPSIAGFVTVGAMTETGVNGDVGPIPLYLRVSVSAAEFLKVTFGPGASGDTWNYTFIVDETDDNGEP